MESNYEKEMNKRNEKIPYEKEMNKRNEKIPYEKEMNKRNEKIPDPQNCLGGGQLLISTLKLFWGGGGEGGGDPYTNQHPTLLVHLFLEINHFRASNTQKNIFLCVVFSRSSSALKGTHPSHLLTLWLPR